MSVSKKYYTAKDIMEQLSVGKNTAYEILHLFEARGQLFRYNRTLRVRADYFERWLSEQEAKPPVQPIYSSAR